MIYFEQLQFCCIKNGVEMTRIKSLFFDGHLWIILLVFSLCSGLFFLFVKSRPSKAELNSLPTQVILFEDYFLDPDGLLTNEYAHHNPADLQAILSESWVMTSGSVFTQDQTAWTGILDSCSPDPLSSICTNSNVFRLWTRQKFEGNINVTFRLRQNGSTSNSESWHGTHIILRQQNPYNFYSLSINRVDENIVIKRKVPCGPSNQGTYFNISNFVSHEWDPNVWNKYMVSIKTEASGNVWLGIYDNSHEPPELLVSGIDVGGTNGNWRSDCQTEGAYPNSAYSPITESGHIGVRGDFVNFNFDDFKVFVEATEFVYLPALLKDE